MVSFEAIELCLLGLALSFVQPASASAAATTISAAAQHRRAAVISRVDRAMAPLASKDRMLSDLAAEASAQRGRPRPAAATPVLHCATDAGVHADGRPSCSLRPREPRPKVWWRSAATPRPNGWYWPIRRAFFPWPHRDLPLLWFSPDPRFLDPLRPRARRPLRCGNTSARGRATRSASTAAFDRVLERLRARRTAGTGRHVDHQRDPLRLRGRYTGSAWRTASRPGSTVSWSAACTASRSARASAASRCPRSPTTHPSSATVTMLRLAVPLAVSTSSTARCTPSTWRASAPRECPRAAVPRRAAPRRGPSRRGAARGTSS